MNFFSKIKDTLKDSVVSNSIKVLFLRVGGAGLQVLVLFLITNFTNETLVGQYNYFNYTIILLSCFVLLGTNTSFLQFSGKFEAEGNSKAILSHYKSCVKILLVSFTIMFLTYWLFSNIITIAYFRDPEISFVLKMVFWTLLPFSLTMLNIEVLRALNILFFSEFIRNIGRFGLLLLFVAALIFYDKTEYLLEAFMLSFIVLAIVSSVAIWKKTSIFKEHKTNIDYKNIIKVSFPMSFSFVSLLVMQSFDIYVLEAYYSFIVVAYYGVAVKISSVVSIILSSINATIAPDISKNFFKKDFEELSLIIKKATRLNVLLSTPFIVLLLIFSEYTLSLFGPNYTLAKNALYIILIGQIVNTFCGPIGLYLNMTGRQTYFQKILIVALIINILMNFILVPKFEMVGAAISTAFSYTFWNVSGLVFILLKDKINLSIFGR